MPINDRRAVRRAFVSASDQAVLIYEFGLVSYHTTEPKLVEDQLRFTKPRDATVAERMDGRY